MGLLRLRLATHLFSNRVSHPRSPMIPRKTGSFTWWRTIQLAIHGINPTVISGVCRSPSARMSAHSRWTILMVKNETVAGFERRKGSGPHEPPPLGLVGSAALFGAGTLLLFVTTRLAVPALVSATGAEPVLMWFLAASAGLFGPLLLTAILLLYGERRTGRSGPWRTRLWLQPMNGGDWLWGVGGPAVAGGGAGGVRARRGG